MAENSGDGSSTAGKEGRKGKREGVGGEGEGHGADTETGSQK